MSVKLLSRPLYTLSQQIQCSLTFVYGTLYLFSYKYSLFVWILLLLSSVTTGLSQNQYTESVAATLEQVSDTAKVNDLNQLSRKYQWKSPEKSKEYARQAYQLASRLNYKKGASYALWKLGSVHELQGNYNKALYYFLESLRIHPPQENTLSKAHALGSIANLYTNLGRYEQAQKYLIQSSAIFKNNSHQLGIGISYRRTGFWQAKQNQLKPALQNYFHSLKIMQALQDTLGIGYLRSYIGQVYFKQEKYEQALQEYNQAITLQDKIGNYAEKAYLLLYTGEIYAQTGHFTKAIEQYNQAMSLATELDFKPALQECYKSLASMYKAKGNFNEALFYSDKFIALHDEIFNKEAMENMADLQIQYQTFEKEQEIELLKKEKEIQALKITEDTHLMYLFSVILLLLTIVSGLIYSRYLLKQKANHTLQSQNAAMVVQKNKIEEQNNLLKEAHTIIESQNQLLQLDKVELEDKVREKTTALMNAYTNLLQVNEEMDTLVYKSSHDLRGPLATFIGVCNIAFLEIKEELALTYFGMLLKNAKRMDNLLHRLLKVNHVKHAEINCLLLQPEQLINETLTALASTEGFDCMHFHTEIAPDASIYSDADLLKTILENLLQNSINYRSSESGKKCSVWIKIEAFEDGMKIFIKDNGIGIPEEYLSKIFNMFFKGTLLSQGSGLGLHIVKAAVHKLQGSIRYCHEITDLTAFEVVIPNLLHKPIVQHLQLIHTDISPIDFSQDL